MSQDNYYKSYRNENNAPLSQLDLNQVHNSHIPQLSSGMKRNSNRVSARQSMIGAARTSLMGVSTRSSNTGLSEMLQQSTARSGRRKSLANINSVHRPSNRTSSFGIFSQTKDPRPLRDKNFQALMQQDIFEFLTLKNFETEMRHPLSQKSLKTPTQKDFVVIFQFLYKKVDPGYRFTKSIEHEVYYVLRNIKYPYLESINKSQISAVGGQSWPVFLGILHWLVQLIAKIQKITDLAELYVDLEESQEDTDRNEMELEKIFVDYVIKSYNAFLNNVDDYSEYFDEMKTEYERYTRDIVVKTQALEAENVELKERYEKLLIEAASLNAVEKKSEALENDLFKFKAYIESMKSRKSKWNGVLKQIEVEMQASVAELKQTDLEKSKIQDHLTSQGLTPNDIDRMNNERDRISKSIDSVNQRLSEIYKIVHSKELEAQQTYEALSNTLKEYNFSIYSIASSDTDMDPSKFVIKLDNLLSEDCLGLRPDVLLNGQDIKTDVRLKLQELKNKRATEIHKTQDEVISLQESLDSINETINERSELVESLEAKLSAGKMDYEELYENMVKDTNSYHTEVEKFENELKVLQTNSKQNMLLLEQHSKTIDMEYNKLVSDIQQEREILHSKAQKMMDKVITFKLNIQASLEDLENMVVDELEKQKEGVQVS